MPRLSFVYPEMLLFLLALALFWGLALATPRRLTPWRFWGSLGIRTALALALIFAAAGAQLVLPVRDLTTVFLLDGSDSLPPSGRAQAETFIQEALNSMPEGNQAAIVVFGGNALVERAPSDEQRLGRIASVPIATRTNIEDAIQLGLALFPSDSQKRLVLLSDGGENDGQALEAAQLAAARGVPITTVDLVLTSSDAEALVARLEAPSRVREGQTATLKATIESTVAQRATVRLIGEAGVLEERTVDLQPGANEVAFGAQIAGTGFQRYRVQVEPERDGRAQNNEAAALIQVQGPPRILVVASERDQAAAIVGALGAANMIAEPISPEGMPQDLAGLSAYEAIILVNTPARDLPVSVMAALPGYVRDLGKGLLMIGGDQSFGVGGYGRTPVEEVLPVYMDVRDREERPDLALVFVIDKSGSMDACHCANPDRNSAQMTSAGTRKIDIAKEAVAQASSLLGPTDSVGVVSFDSRAIRTIEVTQGATVDSVIDAMAPVEPRGSTNVRAGLLEAEAMLSGVDARIKHVILLTDGWGSGGDQADVAERLRDQGITLTVVAAGGGSADYLERLANAGGGRYYPAQDMAEVPEIFVQETITTVGNYIIERPFFPLITSDSPILNGFNGFPQLYGFNGSTLKERSRLVLATDDEQPLLATWQYGLGRSAAWMSDTQGRWASDWLRWDEFPRFAAQMVGYVLPVRGGQDISAEVSVSGGETTVRLETGENNPDMVVNATVIGGDGTRQEVTLSQVGPGSYLGRLESPAPGTYLVQISGNAEDRVLVQETAGLVVPYSSEYRSAQANPGLLAELAALSGGAAIASPEEAFAATDMRVSRAQEIGLPLLLLALILLPFDIALRRLMLRRSDFGTARGWMARRSARTQAAPVEVDPNLERLRGAKRRATAQFSGEQASSTNQAPPPPPPATRTGEKDTPHLPPKPPVAPKTPPAAPPAASDDPLARLRAAKERARRRAAGEEE